MIVQTEEKDLLRDTRSMALLNSNKSALQRRKEEREKARKIEDCITTVEEMKSEFREMKLLLQRMLEKNG